MRLGAGLLVLAAAGCAPAGDPAGNAQVHALGDGRGDPALRGEAALAAALNEDLLASSSATLVLEHWCAERYIADPAVIVAAVERGADKPASAEIRSRLSASRGTPIAYRRVRLMCGNTVLSIADNWYVPGRLTEAMRAALAGDAPFGKVILPLAPHRENLAAELRWAGQQPGELLRHRARVVAKNGQPLAYVVETYQSGIAAGED